MATKKLRMEDLTGRWDSAFLHFASDRLGLAMENWGRHVLCPVHGGVNGNGFRLINDGSGGSFCNTCGNFPNGIKTLAFATGQNEKDVYREVMRYFEGLSSSIDLAELPKYVPPVIDYSKVKRKNQQLWDSGVPIQRTAALKYFVLTRGIKRLIMPSNVRFTNSHGYWCMAEKKSLGNHPCILSAIKDLDGNLLSVHRIYLTPEGKKAALPNPKKVTGTSVANMAGGSIQLYDVSSLKEMGVAEGIETALAATALTGIKCWASYSAEMMESIQLPSHIEKLTIFADLDVSGRGAKAAASLKERLLAERPFLKVEIKFPTLEIPPNSKGVDFLDQLLAA